jgi:hypothetical protein
MWGWGVDSGTPSGLETCTHDCGAGFSGLNDGQLYNPRGIAIDPSGRVAVVDQYNYRIQLFSPSGAYLAKYGSSGAAEMAFGKPRDIAFDSSGNAYIADTNNQRVQVVDSSGNFVRTWGWGVATGAAQLEVCTGTCQAGIQGGSNGQFHDPAGIFVTSFGAVLVADTRNDRVQQFTPDGVFQGVLSTTGSGPLLEPTDMEEDSKGNLVILDEGNHRVVRRVMGTYGFVDAWGWGVVDGSSRYQICTSACLPGLQGDAGGQFNSITGIAVDEKRGFIYVSDVNNDRVSIFNVNGEFIGLWGTNGTAEEQFSHAASVAVDAAGNVYVTDEQNHRVQKQRVGSLETIVAEMFDLNLRLLAPLPRLPSAARSSR